jgi:uncharacterized protein with GYD domain
LRILKPFPFSRFGELVLGLQIFSRLERLNFFVWVLFLEAFMPIYILLSTLTSEGRKTIKERPERIKEVNKEIEAFGAKVLQQYSVIGRYDFVNIVEAPNNDAITRVSIELGSRGTIHIMSMPAMPIDDFVAVLKK